LTFRVGVLVSSLALSVIVGVLGVPSLRRARM
jgi:hypothetical protein